jgi:hypothetical protein
MKTPCNEEFYHYIPVLDRMPESDFSALLAKRKVSYLTSAELDALDREEFFRSEENSLAAVAARELTERGRARIVYQSQTSPLPVRQFFASDKPASLPPLGEESPGFDGLFFPRG